MGEAAKKSLKELVENAERNVYTMDNLLDIYNGASPPPGDLPGFSCEIAYGYKVVYTLEDQNLGRLRHLSVSVATPGKLPDPHAIEAIMEGIGFDYGLEYNKVSMEKIGENHEAVNVYELIGEKHEVKKTTYYNYEED